MAEIDFGALWDSSQLDKNIPVSPQDSTTQPSPIEQTSTDIISQEQVDTQLRESGAQESDIAIARREMEGGTTDVVEDQTTSEEGEVVKHDVSAEPISSQIERIKQNAPEMTDQQILEYFDSNNLGEEAKEALGITTSGSIDPLNMAVRVAGSKDDDTVAQTTLEKALGFAKSTVASLSPANALPQLLKTYQEATDDTRKYVKLQELKAGVDHAYLTGMDRLAGEAIGAYDDRLLREHRVRVRNANQITTELVKAEGYEVRYDEGSGKGQVKMQDGSWKTMDTTFLQELKASKFAELGLIAGGEVARRALKGKGGGKVRAVVAVAGGVVAAGLASGAGDVLDLALDSMVTGQKFESKYYAKRAAQTAKLGMALEALGIVAVGGAIGLVKGSGKLIDHTQSSKIKRHLADAFDYTPEGAEALVKEVEAKGITLIGNTTLDKYISHMAKANPDFNEIASKAFANLGASDSNTVLKQVGDLSRIAVEQMQDVSKLGLKDVYKGWNRYRKLVKDGYNGVKQHGNFIAPDFRYVASENLVPRLRAVLDDYASSTAFDAGSFRDVRRVIDASMEAGSVADSMEIVRQLNKVISMKGESFYPEIIGKLKGEVRDQMFDGIRRHAESPEIGEQFIKDYKTANDQYSKMLKREKQVLGKRLTTDAFSPKKVLKLLDEYEDSPELVQKTLGGMPKKYAHAIEKAYFDRLLSKHGLTRSIADVTSSNPNVAKFNEVAIDFRAISDKMKKFDTTVLSPQGKRLMKTLEVFGDVADNLQTGLARHSASRFKMGELAGTDTTIRTDLRSIANNRMLRKVLTATIRFVPYFPDGKVMALRHRTAKLLANPLDANNLKAMRSSYPKQELESFDKALLELQQAYKLDNKGKLDSYATMLYLRNKSKPQQTKYGRGRVSNVSTKATLDSYPIRADSVLDATTMPRGELDELLNRPSSAVDRGITHILRDGKMFELTERAEEVRQVAEASVAQLARHSKHSGATNDMQALRNIIKIKGSSLTPEENTNFWSYLGDNPKAAKDDVVQWAEVNITKPTELPTALKPK